MTRRGLFGMVLAALLPKPTMTRWYRIRFVKSSENRVLGFTPIKDVQPYITMRFTAEDLAIPEVNQLLNVRCVNGQWQKVNDAQHNVAI